MGQLSLKTSDTEEQIELQEKGLDAAGRYLELRGYELLERCYESRFGSIDFIAKDEDGAFCFIDVKTNSGIDVGLPSDSICAEKQEQIEKIALCYIMENDICADNDPVRFDSIGICVAGTHKALLRHHKNIFNGLV